MTSPLPVPSKAVLRALRGVALGTTCVIGVIVEDRRRRINTLKTAVANGKRLKSHKQYHTAARTRDIEVHDDLTLLDLHWHRRDVPPTPIRRDRPARENSSCMSTPDAAPASHDSAAPAPAEDHSLLPTKAQPGIPDLPQRTESSQPSIRQNISPIRAKIQFKPQECRLPSSQVHNWRSQHRRTLELGEHSPDALELFDSIRRTLDSLAEITEGKDRLHEAVSLFLFNSKVLSASPDKYVELSQRLCVESQERGRLDYAQKILAEGIRYCQMDEQQIFAHRPIVTIESLLPTGNERGSTASDNLRSAFDLFLGAFTHVSPAHGPEVERLAQRIIHEALDRKLGVLVHPIYWRVLGQRGDKSDFTVWLIQTLFDYHQYNKVVKYFLLDYSKIVPSLSSFQKTMDCVVEAVRACGGLKASLVYQAFARMKAAGDVDLRSRWLAIIQSAHWQHYQDFASSKELFEEAKALGLLDGSGTTESLYRGIINISLQAGKEDEAKMYFDEFTYKTPSTNSGSALQEFLEFYTVQKAESGDWKGVYGYFSHWQSLLENEQQNLEAYGRAFASVAKVFAQDHPISEVRIFIDTYMEELGVRLHRHLINIVANKYGECHDVQGFISWLEFCSHAGFSLDSELCNSILHNARKRWSFSHQELQKLLSKMTELNPSTADATTARIMSQASFSHSILPGGRKPSGTKQRLSSTTAVNKPALVGRSMNSRDVYQHMNQALGQSRPLAAVIIYKRATKFGMRFSTHCFRLAITAALWKPNNGIPLAMSLIQNAQAAGHDVSAAISTVIRAQMDGVRGTAAEVMSHMQELMSGLDSAGIPMHPSIMTHAALVCVKLGRHHSALGLCKMAMDKSGSTSRCYSREGFKVHLMVYSQTYNVKGMKGLMESLPESEFFAERKTLLALRDTRRWIRTQSVHRRNGDAIESVLEDMISRVRNIRAERKEARQAIKNATLRIMNDAAAGSEVRAISPMPDETAPTSREALAAWG